METPKTPSELEPATVESLPEQPVTEGDAEAVKGGAMRRDTLDDLEVER
jgi:hypothetical protein